MTQQRSANPAVSLLIVDDNPASLDLLSTRVGTTGYEKF